MTPENQNGITPYPLWAGPISFDDSRLRMTVAGRLLTRVVTYVVYLVLVAAAFTFLLSDIRPLFFTGLFLVLFIIDIAIHYGQGDIPISELKKGQPINVAKLMHSRAFAAIERATDRSAFTKRNFYLETAERLLDLPQIEEGLTRLDVKPAEFRQKLDELLKDSSPKGGAPGDEPLVKAQALAMQGFAEAAAAGHNFVMPADLFSALPRMKDESIDRLFNLFSITPGDLGRALIFSTDKPRGFGRAPRLLGGFIPESHHRVSHRIMNSCRSRRGIWKNY
jgi:hypothetical protein